MTAVPRLRPPFDALRSYPVGQGRSAYVRMDFNEGAPPSAERLARALVLCAGAATAYPDYGPLRLAAARAWQLSAAQVLCVNGADEGIALLLRAFAGPGRTVLLPVPTFPMYRLYAEQAEAPVLEVPLRPDFSLDLEATLAALPGAALLALVSPNNPTGRAVPEGDLMALLEAAGDRPVLLDEAYGVYCGQDCGRLLARFPNLILLRTLSKAHGVPGLRCGFILGHPELVTALEPLRPPFNVNGLAVTLGAWLLEEDRAAHRTRARRSVAARREVQAALEALGIATLPSDTHFFLADLGDRAGAAVAGLRSRSIHIKDLAAVRPGLVRISVALPAEGRAFLNAFLPLWQQLGACS